MTNLPSRALVGDLGLSVAVDAVEVGMMMRICLVAEGLVVVSTYRPDTAPIIILFDFAFRGVLTFGY